MKIFIHLFLLFNILVLTSCTSFLGDYVVNSDDIKPVPDRGWVDEHTFQFAAERTWDNKKKYLISYETPNGDRKPTVLVKLRQNNNRIFNESAIALASGNIGQLVHRINPIRSANDWTEEVEAKLKELGELKVLIVQEEYARDGRVRFIVQIKYHELKKLIECRVLDSIGC